MKFNFLNNPSTWCWTIAVFLFVIYAFKIAAIFGPAIIIAKVVDIDNNISVADLQFGFSKSMEEIARIYKLSTFEAYRLYVYRAGVSLLFLVITPYLAMKKNWARLVIIVLLIIEIVITASPLKINTESIVDLLPYSLIVGILVLPKVKFLFTGVPHYKSPS